MRACVVLIATQARGSSSGMTDPTSFDGVAYRIRDGRPEHRAAGQPRYSAMRPRDLLALSADSEAWLWLRARGVRRPSPSGSRSETATEDKRSTQQLLLRMLPAQIDALRERARSARQTVSAYVIAQLEL